MGTFHLLVANTLVASVTGRTAAGSGARMSFAIETGRVREIHRRGGTFMAPVTSAR
jgi:hypothetical protein